VLLRCRIKGLSFSSSNCAFAVISQSRSTVVR
jgi:hypothetical protein